MARDFHVKEESGIYYATFQGGILQSQSLEKLIEKADPGIEPEIAFKTARVIEKLLGPKREGEHGHIRQGLVGT